MRLTLAALQAKCDLALNALQAKCDSFQGRVLELEAEKVRFQKTARPKQDEEVEMAAHRQHDMLVTVTYHVAGLARLLGSVSNEEDPADVASGYWCLSQMAETLKVGFEKEAGVSSS